MVIKDVIKKLEDMKWTCQNSEIFEVKDGDSDALEVALKILKRIKIENDKVLASPTYDNENGKWIIEVVIGDNVFPIGEFDEENEVLVISQYDSKEDVIKWLDMNSDVFDYDK